ncbi:MAG: hypothetical protein H7Y03_12085 [Chitinophagaceae bacterium]|nr:hypothetical protein [Chitinophagaceae bacterium]
MANNSITIRASNFLYPTREERKLLSEDYPGLSIFNFKATNIVESILEMGESLVEVHKKDNLYWWDNCLQGRLWNLYQSYINTATHFNRGIADGKKIKYDDTTATTLLQFKFYCETFYYYYFSTRDIILHILNVYFTLGIDEHNVKFKVVNDKMIDAETKNILTVFYDQTKKASKIRNAFAHKFPVNRPDYRTILETAEGNTTLGPKGGNCIKDSELMEDIQDSLKSLSSFMEALQKRLTES